MCLQDGPINAATCKTGQTLPDRSILYCCPSHQGDAQALEWLKSSEAGRMKDALPLAGVVGTLCPITRWGHGAGLLLVMEMTA